MRIVSGQTGAVSPVPPTFVSFTQTSNTDGNVVVSDPAYFSRGTTSVTGYTITSTPAGVTGTSATTTIPVTGITAGTSYVFNITATFDNGASATISSASQATVSKATITAPGATLVTTDPTYNYLRYETAGTYTFSITANISPTVMLVGGGGRGGISNATRTGGGGGAGRYIQGNVALQSTSSPYTLVVGAGATTDTTAGGNTTGFNITMAGGGYGGAAAYATSGNAGGSGGSGGGGGAGGTVATAGTSGRGQPVITNGGTGNQGGAGGYSQNTSTSASQGGTGGGAGAAGISGAVGSATSATISGAGTGLTASGTAGTSTVYDAHWNTAGGGAAVIAQGGDSTLNTLTAQTLPGSGGHSSQTASARTGKAGAIYVRYMKASAW